MRKIKSLSFIGIAVIATLLSGCSQQSPNNNIPNEPTTVAEPGIKYPLNPIDNPEALQYCPNIEAVSFDDSGISLRTKDIKTVYICQNDAVTTTTPVTDTEFSTHVYQVAPQEVTNLLEKYSQPNEIVQKDLMCPEMLADPLIIWVTTGSAEPTAIYAPVSQCGFPLKSVADVYSGLELTEVLVNGNHIIID